MVSAPNYELLLGASDRFLEDADFGPAAIEAVMCKVFGQYCDRDKSDGCDARAWGQYFNEINIYEEAGGEGNMSVEKPLVRPHIICFIMQTANFVQLPTTAVLIDETEDDKDETMDLDLPSSAPTQPTQSSQLSLATLQEHAADRAIERATRRTNGNQFPRELKKTGAPLDTLCAKLVIQCEKLSEKKGHVVTYFCIGCDKERANNSQSRALSHSVDCVVCILSCSYLQYTHQYHCLKAIQTDWPDEFKLVQVRLNRGGVANVVAGTAKAPAVRSNKRKAVEEDNSRVPASFAPPVKLEQTILEESWGENKITPVRQAKIDFFLLRFIVCCFVSFLVVDSGFFMDFVNAL